MDFSHPSSFIQLAPPRGGRSLPGVKFVPAGSASARRGARPLVSYASPEGAAWFEALMADLLDPPAAAEAPEAQAAPADRARACEPSAARRRGAGPQR